MRVNAGGDGAVADAVAASAADAAEVAALVDAADAAAPIALASGARTATSARTLSCPFDFLTLTKPRIVLLVVLTTLFGLGVAGEGRPMPPRLVFFALLGTALATGGANALNMYLERDADALMERTRTRPLPAARIAPPRALAFGVVLSAAGVALLAARVNLLTALLGAASVLLYVLLYTPLKRRSPVCTFVGAVPGAIPPVMGWTAARDALAPGAAALFAILFLWQLPHFFAIAWMFREDYARAGFPMLSVLDPTGASTARQAVLGVIALLAASLAPAAGGMAGAAYAAAAIALGAAFLAFALRFAARLRDPAAARHLFYVSIVYLPLLLGLLALGARR
jgi:protoheme IX farnesyltransferase